MRATLHIILFSLIFLCKISAHEGRPLYIQVSEIDSGIYFLKINIPNSVAQNNLPELIFPATFIEKKSVRTIRTTTSGYSLTTQLESKGETIIGKIFKIQYPKFNPAITSIIQIQLMGEATQIIVVSPKENQFIIPKDPSQLEVIQQYSLLGIKHIWGGIDHLLFVACLVLIAGFGKKLLIAITGFTLAHSITLFLAALNFIQLPIPPIEACIALSILFLCYEIIHHRQTKSTLTYRHPIAVSSSFGLLHGLGFAAVLSEIGLPHKSKLAGLLFFNVGVEIGQIFFIILLFVLISGIMWILKNSMTETRRLLLFKIGIYATGILASYWFFERLF